MYLSYAKLAIDNIRKCGTIASALTGEIAMTPKEKKSGLTAQWLRENMTYDPLTGIFAWSKPGFGRTVGKTIGSNVAPHPEAYKTMKVNGDIFYAHRLAWLYVNGEWPKATIDHIDENRMNNAIDNLREATSAQNAARRETTRTIGTSRGVFPQRGGFVARLHHAGKRHYLGFFKTAGAAQAAYEAKAKEIHGEFAYVEQMTPFDRATTDAVARSPHRDWLLVATPGFGVQ